MNGVVFGVGGESRRKATSTPAKAKPLPSTNVNTAMLVPSTAAPTDQSTMGTPIVIGTTGLRPQAELAAVPALGRVVSQQVIIENMQDEQNGSTNSDQAQLSGSSFETNPFAGQSPYTGPELLLPVTYQPFIQSVRDSVEDQRHSLQDRHRERQQRGQNENEDASQRQLGHGLQTEIEANDRAPAERARLHDENITVGVWENNPNVVRLLSMCNTRIVKVVTNASSGLFTATVQSKTSGWATSLPSKQPNHRPACASSFCNSSHSHLPRRGTYFNLVKCKWACIRICQFLGSTKSKPPYQYFCFWRLFLVF